MTDRAFLQLNDSWNAEPNVPAPEVEENGSEVTLRFLLDPWAYEAATGEQGLLTFGGCSKWRLGGTNDEGWFLGQCRYSAIAPAWGEFYEIVGPDPLAHAPTDWKTTNQVNAGKRHFLFYLRDETFECFADEWCFSRPRLFPLVGRNQTSRLVRAAQTSELLVPRPDPRAGKDHHGERDQHPGPAGGEARH